MLLFILTLQSIISAVVSYTQVAQHVNSLEINDYTLLLNYFALLLSVVESIVSLSKNYSLKCVFQVFIILGVHNRRKYLQHFAIVKNDHQVKDGQERKQKQKSKRQDLSERYQVALQIYTDHLEFYLKINILKGVKFSSQPSNSITNLFSFKFKNIRYEHL